MGVQSLHVVDEEALSKKFPEKWDLADPCPEWKDLSDLEKPLAYISKNYYVLVLNQEM